MKYKSLRLLSSLFAIALLFSMIPMAHASSTRAVSYTHLGALPEPADDLIQRLLPDKVAAVLKDLRHPALLVRGGLSPGLHLTDNGAGHGLHHHAIEKAQLLRRVAALEIEQPPAAVAVSPCLLYTSRCV